MTRILFLSGMICYGLLFGGCDKQAEKRYVLDTLGAASAITPNVAISFNEKQSIQLGVDAKRLWNWRKGIKDQLAQLAVGEMNADFVRAAVRVGQERDEGIFEATTYNTDINMMDAMKTANPDVKFFASPSPMSEAYSAAEREAIWGHRENVPWACYPAWILEWDSVGTKTMDDGTVVPKWEKGDFHIDKLVQYYADYLNLMKTKGFDIAYLDVVNENNVMTPTYCRYIKDSLPSRLDPGVTVPELVVPSSWSVQAGINWLNAIDPANNEQHGFKVAAVHNTGGGGSLETFTSLANGLGKDAWNTELHKWKGVNMYDEVMTSAIFWEHMRAGFTGIATWLFFGPVNGGQPHSMIWSNPQGTVIKSGKYEIFKQVINNANGGKYVDVTMPSENAPTAAFVKDDILSVWILNKDSTTMEDLDFDLAAKDISGKTVEVIKWHGGLSYDNEEQAGEASSFVATEPRHFTYDIEGESLYFFKVNLNNE